MKHLCFVLIILNLLTGTSFASAPAANARPATEREHFTYYCSSPIYLDRVDSSLNRARETLFYLLGDTLDYRPSVYIVDDAGEFNQLIGGKFPDWGAAAAFPERRLIAIKSPGHFNLNRSIEELVAHEYAHLVIAHATGLFSAPRWFEEGVAMYVSAEWSWSDNLAMSKAAVFGQLIDLTEIDNVNRFNDARAHLAYAQSYLAVKFIVDTYDEDALSRFLESLSKGQSADDALLEATGSNEAEFSADFGAHINRSFNMTSLFMDTMFFWLGLAIIVIIGSWLRVRKKKRFYRKWERQERLESTDFDYGDPDNPEKLDDDDEPWRS